MIYSIADINFNVEYNSLSLEKKIPIVFFHGFTGSVKDWYFLKNKLPQNFEPIFIDLIGHGKTDSPKNEGKYTFDSQIDQIDKLFAKLKIHNPVLIGYSMGGRLALAYSFKFPSNVRALLLESASFGIEEKVEKESRILNDRKLANKIKNTSLEKFIKNWMNLPLFETQKRMNIENQNFVYNNKVDSNNKIGLVNSLLGFGTGRMENFYPQLSNFEIKTLLVAGELDMKYSQILKNANSLLPNSKLKIIKNCGHNVHLEKTEDFLKLLNEFLLNIRDEK